MQVNTSHKLSTIRPGQGLFGQNLSYFCLAQCLIVEIIKSQRKKAGAQSHQCIIFKLRGPWFSLDTMRIYLGIMNSINCHSLPGGCEVSAVYDIFIKTSSVILLFLGKASSINYHILHLS